MKRQSETAIKTGGGRWARSAVFLALILTMGTWAAGTTAKSKLTNEYPPPGQLVDARGYQMHIHCTGQGEPTVILEAGLDDFSIFWSQVQPEVARFTRVCSYDRAGYGWSDPSPYPRTSEVMVEELHNLLAAAHVERPYVLVGHSFGGALVRLFAHHYPGEVLGMVLVDAVHDELFVRVPIWRIPIESKIAMFRTLASLSSLGLLAFEPENIPNRGIPGETLRQYRAIAVSSDYFHTGAAENEAFESNLSQVRAARIHLGDLPLVVISEALWNPLAGLDGISLDEAESAQQAWQAMQAELQALSTRSRQVIAKESGHYIQFDQPQLVIEAIREIAASSQN